MIRTQTQSESTVTETGRLGHLYRVHAPGAARLAYLLTGDRSWRKTSSRRPSSGSTGDSGTSGTPRRSRRTCDAPW